VFFAVLVLSFIFCAIRPFFDTTTMLLILDPFAYIGGTICVFVGSVAMRFIIAPRPFVYISVRMNQNTMPIRLIILPLAVVLAAVLPDLLSIAVLHTVQQLTCVDCAIT
jgi:hypothetical protein